MRCQQAPSTLAGLGLRHSPAAPPSICCCSALQSLTSGKPCVLLHGRRAALLLSKTDRDIGGSSLHSFFFLPYSADSSQLLPSSVLSASSAHRAAVVCVGSSSLCQSQENITRLTSRAFLPGAHRLVLHVVWCLRAVASHLFCPILWLRQAGQVPVTRSQLEVDVFSQSQ